MQITVYDLKNTPKDKIEISDLMFNNDVNNYLIWLAVKVEEANRRVGTADTKTKAEVTGSGKKPWRQKGTGRARVGTKRNPVWRGGGVAFGPHPRDFSLKMNRKMKRLAYISIFSLKNKKEQLKFIEDITLSEAKAKEFAGLMKQLDVKPSTLLIYGDKKFIDSEGTNQVLSLSENDRKIKVASANIPEVKTMHWNMLAAKELFYAKNVLITESALHYLEEKYLPHVTQKVTETN